MKDIECSDLISTRYLSEIDEVLVSSLSSRPSLASGIFMALHLSGALVVYHPKDGPNHTQWMLSETALALVVHGLIFRFVYGENQQTILHSSILSFTAPEAATLLFGFLSDP